MKMGTPKYLGMKVGALEVVEYIGQKNYRCQCECGKTVERYSITLTNALASGKQISCGCIKPIKPMKPMKSVKPMKPAKYTGQKIGYLEVLERLGDGTYRCQCECGQVVQKVSWALGKASNARVSEISCGCKPEAKKDTLCWTCRRATGFCNWTHEFKPVPGWGAEPIPMAIGKKIVDSYRVISCPKYLSRRAAS